MFVSLSVSMFVKVSTPPSGHKTNNPSMSTKELFFEGHQNSKCTSVEKVISYFKVGQIWFYALDVRTWLN